MPGQPRQSGRREHGDQYGQESLCPAVRTVLGGGQQAVKDVPERHAQAHGKQTRRTHGIFLAAGAEDHHRKDHGQGQHDPETPVQVQLAEIVELFPLAGGVIPGLVDRGPPGLAQPGQGMSPADEGDGNAQSQHADDDILSHPQSHGPDFCAVLPQQEQSVSQRYGQVHGCTHVVAPGDHSPGDEGHRQGGAEGQVSPQALCVGFGREGPPQAESHPAQQNRNGQCPRTDHAGAVAAGRRIAQQVPQPVHAGQVRPLHRQQAVGAQGGGHGPGSASGAEHRPADGQHQQFKAEPGQELGGKHTAGKGVAHQ